MACYSVQLIFTYNGYSVDVKEFENGPDRAREVGFAIRNRRAPNVDVKLLYYPGGMHWSNACPEVVDSFPSKGGAAAALKRIRKACKAHFTRVWAEERAKRTNQYGD